MSIIFFAQTAFGFLFATRILRKFRRRSLVSQRTLTKIGTAFAASMCFVAFMQPRVPRLSFFTVIFAVFALEFSVHCAEKAVIVRLQHEFPLFLAKWRLNLRVGIPATTARERALNDSDETFRTLLRPVFALTDSKHVPASHAFLNENCLRELIELQKQSHNTLQRLTEMRANLIRESDFRRKSGQALRQASIQSLVMVALHFALCVFVGLRFGFLRNIDVIGLSTVLTASGAWFLRLIARRIRWSV